MIRDNRTDTNKSLFLNRAYQRTTQPLTTTIPFQDNRALCLNLEDKKSFQTRQLLNTSGKLMSVPYKNESHLSLIHHYKYPEMISMQERQSRAFVQTM